MTHVNDATKTSRKRIVKTAFRNHASQCDFSEADWITILAANEAGTRISIKFKVGKRRKIKKASVQITEASCGCCPPMSVRIYA